MLRHVVAGPSPRAGLLLAAEPLQRLAHGRSELRMLVDIVVPGTGDGAVEDEVGGAAAKRLGPRGKDEVVALGGEDRDRHPRGREIGGGGDLVAEEEPHRKPAIMVRGHRSERIVGRDQDRAGDRPFPGEMRRDAGADAEPDGDDGRGAVATDQLVVDQRRVGQ
jgi:hypothetical protein